MTPWLDILICTLGAKGIERIAAHAHPEYPGVRYVVSVQSMPDGYQLPQRLRKSDFKVIKCPGKGLSRNRNNALRNAEAEISMIADDDLDFVPEYFDNILNAFESHPQADAIFHTYESADYPKVFPAETFDFSQKIPKGYFVTSFEITFRTQKIKGRFQFDENFGIGAKYPSGEEDIFVNKLRRNGMRIVFVPTPIARHDGSTTSDRVRFSPSYIRTKGAVMRRIYPFTWFGRMLTHAMRHSKDAVGTSFIPTLKYVKYWLEGSFGKS